MKNILLLFSTILLCSCADLLNTSPASSVASGNMWTNEDYADKGIAGLYHNFMPTGVNTSSIYIYNDDFNGIDRQLWMGMEFQSIMTGSNGLYALTYATKSASDRVVTYEWQWCYTAIHQINDAIENLYKAGLSEEKYDRYMCEAKFLRAFYYSYLNKIYQGVPLYLRVISQEECTQSQATSTEVWDAVISDLTDCIECEHFPDNTVTENHGRPSKGAAYSLRGMAYMWLAWENGEDNAYYQLAANDFERVSECGYGLWAGKFIDFFRWENEKDHEMIFPIQFTTTAGYCDYLQLILGGRDSYVGWSHIRPSFDFVTYFQNADGSKFEWTSRIPEWDNAEFLEDINRREVFFLRDSISLDDNDKVVRDYWSESEAGQIQTRIDRMGVDVFRKYYKPGENGVGGNEDRIRDAYNDRDPRLKDIVLTPYDPYDTFFLSTDNNGQTQIGKELRWPFLKEESDDYGDYYIGTSLYSTYIYKKYSYHILGEIPDRCFCPTDWPLIRFTNVYLYLAECYVHLGRLADAVSIVNEIRSRAEMPPVSVGSADEVMEAVKYERRVELCAEGIDYFDEWRWGTYKEMKFQGKDVYGAQSLWGEWENYMYTWYYTDTMFPWPAPTEECQRNPNLTRREGWSY